MFIYKLQNFKKKNFVPGVLVHVVKSFMHLLL